MTGSPWLRPIARRQIIASRVGPVGGGNAASIAWRVARVERKRQGIVVRADVFEIGRFRNGHDARRAHDPAQRDLRRG